MAVPSQGVGKTLAKALPTWPRPPHSRSSRGGFHEAPGKSARRGDCNPEATDIQVVGPRRRNEGRPGLAYSRCARYVYPIPIYGIRSRVGVDPTRWTGAWDMLSAP